MEVIEQEESTYSYSKQKTSDLSTTINNDNLQDAHTLQLTQKATESHEILTNMFDCCLNSLRILFNSAVVYSPHIQKNKM